MLDSGCSEHITCELSDYVTYTSCPPHYVTLADKKEMKVKYHRYGTVRATTLVDGNEENIVLQNILYSPDLNGHFILTTSLTENGVVIIFKEKEATLLMNNEMAACAYLHNRQW
jgi:hypothetical protein